MSKGRKIRCDAKTFEQTLSDTQYTKRIKEFNRLKAMLSAVLNALEIQNYDERISGIPLNEIRAWHEQYKEEIYDQLLFNEALHNLPINVKE